MVPYSIAAIDAVHRSMIIWMICLVLVTWADFDVKSSLCLAQRPAIVVFKRYLIVAVGMLGIWGLMYIMHLSPTEIREAAGAYWNAGIDGKITTVIAWAVLVSPLLALNTVGRIEQARRAEMRDRVRMILAAD